MPVKPRFLQIGDMQFNPADWTLSRSGKRLPLTRQSGQLLGYLIENRDRTVPRDELIERFWSLDSIGADDRLNTCVRRIRSVIDANASTDSLIETRPRVGYQFVGDVVEPFSRSERTPKATGNLKWWIGGALGSTAVVAVVSVIVSGWPSPPAATSGSVYRNDGYRLDKSGTLKSSCDFEFEGGPGWCDIKGEGIVTFSYRDRFLLRVEVTPTRDVRCELGDGEVSCS
ncbi:MAG: helix-turn-helix domain-containing protein [Woeseiaceae bacterium]|nr:helix-turn-helix domain-containing protein [Woeseiaceae bacterium]